MRPANGRRPTNAVWDALSRRRRPDPTACPSCDVDNKPMTLNDALAAVVAEGKTDGAVFEIRECTQVPDRVHVVFPPDDGTGQRP